MNTVKSFSFLAKTKLAHRFYSSALYVTGDKATSTCALLTPYIDFKQYENKFDELADNAKYRQLNIDITELKKLWNLHDDLNKTKKKLNDYRAKISEKIKVLQENSTEASNDELTKLINSGKIVKDDLKMLKECFQPVEENLITKILQLPNVLYKLTPLSEERIEFSYLDKPTNKSEHHIKIGEQLRLLNYMNPHTYYLTNEAALMELGLLKFVSEHLDKNDFVPFCLPDFTRSAIVEGCGIDFENLKSVFTLKDPKESKDDISKLHLTGTASLYSFMAYHTKLMLYPSVFPLHYYSSGRQYMPSTNTMNGLFQPSQSSCVHLFAATLNSNDEMEKEFFKTVTMCIEMYKSINHHFQVVYMPASKLEKSESLKISFQMYSSHFQKYVEVGYISMYDDYLSKRLLFTYKEGKINVFPKVISGTIVNFAKLFGCILEENPGKFVVPDVCRL